jgi:hypothetical protein
MPTVRHIAEHLLTPFPRRIGQEGIRLPQCDTAIPAKPSLVGPDAARLYPQCKAGKSAVVELKGLFRGLGHFAREQVRSNDGAHGEISSDGSREAESWQVEEITR